MQQPFHGHWYVTTRCNSRCSTCSIWSDPLYHSPESNYHERVNLLYQMKEMGIKSIDFTGGEPLLTKDLIPLMKTAHKLGIFTSLTTNGTLYSKFAAQLHGIVSALSFSLDAADRDSHNKLRGIDCYDKVVKSILLARSLGEVVMIKTTVTNGNYKDLGKLIEFAQRLGVLIELNPEFKYFNNPALEKKKILGLFRWWKHPNVIISHAHLHFMLDDGNDITHSRCQNGSTVLVITPNNQLFLPCMHKVYNSLPLVENDLKKTLNSETMKNERFWMGKHPVCENCTIPCYFEPTYYTNFDKYFLLTLYSRIGYIKKRLVLQLKNHFHSVR